MTGYVAICGPGEDATEEDCADAFAIAAGLAGDGVIVLSGGLGGVMAGAAAGVRSVGGLSIGFLPGADRSSADPGLSLSIPTGMGELRNGLLVRSADVVVVVGGSWGTLSELALAVRIGKAVVSLRTWQVGPDKSHPMSAMWQQADSVEAVLDMARFQLGIGLRPDGV